MTTLFVTVPQDAAENIAKPLINEDLAACVNVVECQSYYQWEDRLQTDSEAILFVKTTATAYPAVKDRITELHPYEVPCIERFEEQDILDVYADWVSQQVNTPE